ncbi:Glycogen synthase [compost metagenome]
MPLSYILTIIARIFRFPSTLANLVGNKKKELSTLNESCNRIEVFTNWQADIFLANGFTKEKIKLTTQLMGKKVAPYLISDKKEIRTIGFIGRLTYEKGLHILIHAFKNLQNKKLQLKIAGIRNKSNEIYLDSLLEISKGNPNISWEFDLNNNQVKEFYTKVDLICIPSISYETGPFVLYEAFENKLPVIANDLGDMRVWKDKGFPIYLYKKPEELIELLKKI